MLGLYAGTDSFVTPAVIDRMEAELVKSGSGSQIVVFPTVNHGFNADFRACGPDVAQYAALKPPST